MVGALDAGKLTIIFYIYTASVIVRTFPKKNHKFQTTDFEKTSGFKI